MIGRLNGKLVEKQPPLIVIECFGVGYEVEAPMSTICDLPELGSSVTLFTHHHIRDDANLLFGFLTTKERELFRVLTKVNGVGNRMALTILSGVSIGEFVRVVKNDQWQQLTSLPGVGRKTAERILVEVRDRLDSFNENFGIDNSKVNVQNDAILGLVSLGYKKNEAVKFVEKANPDIYTSQEIIRQVLKNVLSKDTD
ncbi:MAG: Holliday junction branch migration protein RuvA [Methylococcaceae bacterium TMED69]|nr:Holliday junction branch migration protein RuvA [Pseudomonadota bacterium]OUU75269.1 MAG: Holliday junction branch migration protein RuvA [Methylococcaceae bacterium TMED69]|tara:strand:- start:6772 stop:7365 length:594 start_codon:yes stop_codon:yes gene_type:complete